MDEDLKQLEADLGNLRPLGMPDDMLARLDQAMCRWHESVPELEKIVPIKSAGASTTSQIISPATTISSRASRHFPLLASAAAVAVLGAISANVYLKKDPVLAQISSQPIPTTVASAVSPANPLLNDFTQAGSSNASFHPVSAKTDVINAADRGIVYLANGQAARCLAIHYQDQLEYQNEKGELLKLNKPELKMIYVPIKTD